MKLEQSLFIYVILLATALLAVGCAGKATETTDEEVINTSDGANISKTSANSAHPIISADPDGNVYLTWEEASSDNSRTEIFLARSTNSGSSFIKSFPNKGGNCTVSGHANEVSAAFSNDGSFNAVWTDDGKIKFYNSALNTCKSVSSTKDASSPEINDYGNGKLHVIWEEDIGSLKRDIFFRQSDNGGTDFIPSLDSEPLNISNTASDSSDPMLGVMEGSLNTDIDVVWVEGAEGSRNITIASSADSGASFTSPLTILDTVTDSYCPVINVTDSGTVYLVFKGDSGIYFTKRQSSVSSFTDPVKISPDSVSPSCPEMGVASNGMIHTVWSDSGEIWTALSSDSGHSFTTPKNISSTTGTSSSPKMAMDGNYINLVWVEEDTGKGDIYFSGSIDHGKSFSSPVNISDSSDTSAEPVVAADGKDYIYIAWVEGDDNSGDIYYIRDQGARGLATNAEKPLSKFLDINGDGKSDILIGAPSDKDGTVIGKVYVYYGSDMMTDTPDLTLSEASAGDQFGVSVAIAGDVNGDGYADIITGAPYNDDNAVNSGVVYIYYGSQSSMDNTADVTIKGLADNDYAGYAVSSAGDVNNDGFDDVIIGLPDSHGAIPYSGTAVIFFGGPNLGSKANYPVLDIDDADIVLNGEDAHDKFGSAVSRAGDFNNDGFDDVAVSAPYSGDSFSKKGSVYIYFGGSPMNSKADIQITGESNIDKIGLSLAGGNDINSDVYSDVIIGAPDADLISESIVDAGKVYIIYGFNSSDDDELTLIDAGDTSSSVTVLKGEKYKEFFGTSVGNAGDFNGDTYTDVIVGSAYIGTDTSYKDNARLYYGGPAMDSTVDVTFSDNKHEDGFGITVAGAGDVDGDGYYDALVGAYFADGGGTDRGLVYLYRGNTIPDTDTDATFTGTVDNGWAGYSLNRIQY